MKTVTLKLVHTETYIVPVVTEDDSIDIEEYLNNAEYADLNEIAGAMRDGFDIVGMPKFSPVDSEFNIHVKKGCDFDPEVNFHVVLEKDGFDYRPVDSLTEPSILPKWDDARRFIRRLTLGDITYDIYRDEIEDEPVMWVARYGAGLGEYLGMEERTLLNLGSNDWDLLRQYAPMYQALQAFVKTWLEGEEGKQ